MSCQLSKKRKISSSAQDVTDDYASLCFPPYPLKSYQSYVNFVNMNSTTGPDWFKEDTAFYEIAHGITKGNGNYQRIGRSIRVKNIMIKYVMTPYNTGYNYSTFYQTCQLNEMLFTTDNDFNPSNVYPFSISQAVSPTIELSDKMNMLYYRNYSIGMHNPTTNTIGFQSSYVDSRTYNIPCDFEIVYDASSNLPSDVTTNKLYVAVSCDNSQLNLGQYQFPVVVDCHFRIDFLDL